MKLEHLWYTIPLRLRSLFSRPTVENELDEELQFHVERQIEQNIARGMTPEIARTEALRALGGYERRKEQMRDTRRVSVLENLVRDARYALRGLMRNPGFAVVAIVTLALGIGANTAIFTVVNAVLLRPLDYHEPDRLVAIQYKESNTVAPPSYFDWKNANRSLAAVGAEEYWTPNLTGRERAEELRGVHITSDILPLLGVRPLLGRVFLPEEEHTGKSHVVVLRYDLWQSHFAGDRSVVGRTISLDGDPYTVIGVMPRGFEFTPYWAKDAQLASPLVLDERRNDRRGASLRAFGRLGPGVTIDNATHEVTSLTPSDERTYPGVSIVPLKDLVVGDVQPALLILLAAVGLVLLIACANVAHLQLIRGAAREREAALRTAIGASRARLIQQSLVESLILAAMGALLGLLLAYGGVKLLVRLGPANLPRLDTIGMDGSVFLFMLIATALSGIGFGLVPALSSSRPNVHDAIKEGARSAADNAARRRVRDSLVASEFALALVLLVSVGLVLRSFFALMHVQPGYDARNIVSMQVSVRGTQHGSTTMREPFFRELVDRVGTLPGVASVSAINHLPLHGDNWHFPVAIEGEPLARKGETPVALFRIVRPGYFRTMRVGMVAGRDFNAQDQLAGSKVVVINDVMARRFFHNASPIGKRLTVDDPVTNPNWFTVVGVVKATRGESWSVGDQGEMYFPHLPGLEESSGAPSLTGFLNPRSMTIVVRTKSASTALVPEIQRLVQAMDRDAPVSDVITMEGAIAEQMSSPAFYLLMLGIFAAVALVLAAVGVYGVISYSVARRTREIGLRMALGADRRDSFELVVGHGMRVAGLGLGAGIIGALAFTRFVRSLLFGVKPTDILTYAGVVMLLVIVAFIACGIPALRATRVSPMVALRSE